MSKTTIGILQSNDILPMSEKGIVKAMEWADDFMHKNSTSLHMHHMEDAQRLFNDWKTETNPTKKKKKREYFDQFCEFMKSENKMEIADEQMK